MKRDNRKLPDFLVLSVPKSGTTSLHLTLKEHPEICMPLQKETWFFDQNFEKGVDWYEEKFWHCPRKATIGEVTTHVFLKEKYIKRVKKVIPRVKIIVLLRDPVERCISHYFHNIRESLEEETFEKALEKERSRVEENPAMYSVFAYTKIGSVYKDNIQKLLLFFSREQVKIIFFEELVNNQRGVLKELYDFIGVGLGPEKLARANVARMPRSKTLKRVLEIPSYILKLIYNSKFVQRITSPSIRRRTRVKRSKISRFFGGLPEMIHRRTEKPKIPKDERKKLEDIFNYRLEGLSKVTKRNISNYWKWFKE